SLAESGPILPCAWRSPELRGSSFRPGWKLRRAPSNLPDFLLYLPVVMRRNGLGAHFFLPQLILSDDDEIRRTARADATPVGVRARRLGGCSRGQARPRFHRQAERHHRRRLRAGGKSPHAAVSRGEHRVRTAGSLIARPCPPAEETGGFSPALR